MSRPVTAVLLAAGFAIATPALSADRVSKAAYDHEKDRIAAEYKADKERCASLSGNAKDICRAEAKGREMTAKAEAEANYKGTVAARTDALIARADAELAVAGEKCDDLAGNAKDVCVKEAKAAHIRAKADAKATRKVSEVRKDAAEEKRDANYDVAKERCETYSGDTRTQCIRDAKARFGKS